MMFKLKAVIVSCVWQQEVLLVGAARKRQLVRLLVRRADDGGGAMDDGGADGGHADAVAVCDFTTPACPYPSEEERKAGLSEAQKQTLNKAIKGNI